MPSVKNNQSKKINLSNRHVLWFLFSFYA